MTGKCYYLTTLADWRRHASRFATSHFVALESPLVSNAAVADASSRSNAVPDAAGTAPSSMSASSREPAGGNSRDATTKILVLVEADEGVHLSLEDEPAFEALPHPLAQKPISSAAQYALAPHGVAPGATTFDAAEAIARLHPLLRHRVF